MPSVPALAHSSRSRAVGALLALLIIITGFPLSGAAFARQADDNPLDLPAMVLRPSDLEAEGIDLAGETRFHRDACEYR